MRILGEIIKLLKTVMPVPTQYGWFHLLWIAITVSATIFICVRYRNSDDKVFRRIALIGWIIMLIIESYKQIAYTFSWDGTSITLDYQWWAFPFQLCSMPIYVLPFVIFMKEGKVKDACISFILSCLIF